MHAPGTATGPGSALPGQRGLPVLRPSPAGRGIGRVLLALMCAALLLLMAPVPWPPLHGRPEAPVGCAEPAPETADAYTAAFARVPGGWLAGDQVSSTSLPDGRILWVFADTLVDAGETGTGAGVRFIHSSFILQSAGCFTPVLGPAGDGVVPAPGPGQWYWPQHAVIDGRSVWVTALRVTGGQANTMGFQLHGVDLAEFELTADGTARFVTMHATPASEAGEFGVLWGTALVADEAELYVYGTRRTTDPLAGKQLLLGRVALSQVAEASAWRFRTRHGWSADPADAAVLVPAAGGVSTSLSAHRTAAGWVLVTKRDDFLGDAVVALLGPDPWGPFQEQVLFGSTTRGTALEYLAMAHPEVTLADGSLLVSINHNDMSLSTVLRDPAAFRPTFHAVTGLGTPRPG